MLVYTEDSSKQHRIEINYQIDNWVSSNIGEFKFRKYQKEKIIDIIENIIYTKENHNHIIEAPTGSGKSIIIMISAGVLAKYYNIWSYILCSDLYLWDQYANFIKAHNKMNFGIIKGQSGNYECSINHEDIRNSDCRMGGIAWNSLFSKKNANKLGYVCANTCEYIQARKKCLKSPVVLMTYQMFLYHINRENNEIDFSDDYSNIEQNSINESYNNFTNRPVIFCDECHNIPDIIQSKMTPVIKKTDFAKFALLYNWALDYCKTSLDDVYYKLLDKYPTFELLYTDYMNIFNNDFLNANTSSEDNLNAINKYINIISLFENVVETIQFNISMKKQFKLPIGITNIKLYKATSFFTNHMCYLDDFSKAINAVGSEYLIKQINETNDGEHIIQFSCTKEDWMIYQYLLNQANFKVMLSATIGGKEAFEENMGIKYTNDGSSKFDVIPSTFNFDKSPIIFFPNYKMSYGEKNRSFDTIKQVIFNLIKQYFPNYKGIIQTGNYGLAKKIMADAPQELADRFLLYNGNKEKSQIIEKHKKSNNTIIVGPTLMEGIDLPDNNCRFIIILKIPYPNINDKLVSAKMKLFPLWYNSKTSNSIIQGIGRGIRNEKDWCYTYIFDGCFSNLYRKTKDQYSIELQNRLKLAKL